MARLDRKRSKKGRNTDWRHPHDPDARITKMKDGRTHLAHTAEHAVDLETGAIVGVTVQGADQGDTTTIAATVTTAADALEAVATVTDEDTAVIDEVVAGQGVSQQSDARRSGAARRTDLHRRTEPGPASMEAQGRGPRRGPRQPAVDPRPTGVRLAAVP